MRAMPSLDAVTINLPSGLNCASLNLTVSSILRSSAPVFACQTRMLSAEALTRVPPSGTVGDVLYFLGVTGKQEARTRARYVPNPGAAIR